MPSGANGLYPRALRGPNCVIVPRTTTRLAGPRSRSGYLLSGGCQLAVEQFISGTNTSVFANLTKLACCADFPAFGGSFPLIRGARHPCYTNLPQALPPHFALVCPNHRPVRVYGVFFALGITLAGAPCLRYNLMADAEESWWYHRRDRPEIQWQTG